MRLFALLLVVVLAGCQTRPQERPDAPIAQSWESRRAHLQQRELFNLKARVAVAAGQEGFNARLRWMQQREQSQLSLDGPLGVGGAQVNFDGSALQVMTARGQQLSDAAARDELQARLGFTPPLRSLRFWVQGVPDPAMPAEEVLDEQGRLASLRQDGWQIEYASYVVAGGKWLPERVTLRRDDVRVRLMIDGWGS